MLKDINSEKPINQNPIIRIPTFLFSHCRRPNEETIKAKKIKTKQNKRTNKPNLEAEPVTERPVRKKFRLVATLPVTNHG